MKSRKKESRKRVVIKYLYLSKLTLINDYNRYMGGFDRNDTFIGNYAFVKPSNGK